MKWTITLLYCLTQCLSCVSYTPKPSGYFRIEPPVAHYYKLDIEGLPYTFDVSELATVAQDARTKVITLSYSSLGATVYCDYRRIKLSEWDDIDRESRELVARKAKQVSLIKERYYSDPSKQLYGSLFMLGGESASPIQFLLTDSMSMFFRGALYYDKAPNADSLAPVTDYLRQDIIELITSFNWRK